jgi:hypothetical protein
MKKGGTSDLVPSTAASQSKDYTEHSKSQWLQAVNTVGLSSSTILVAILP